VFFLFFLNLFLMGFFTPSSHQHKQASHEKSYHTQQNHSCEIFCDFSEVLSAVFGTLVCVVDVPADAVANVTKFSLDVFHGLFPLSFICLYCIMDCGICQLSDCTNKCRKKLAELCILPKFGGHAGATKINGFHLDGSLVDNLAVLSLVAMLCASVFGVLSISSKAVASLGVLEFVVVHHCCSLLCFCTLIVSHHYQFVKHYFSNT
jgi:hypothetical protein